MKSLSDSSKSLRQVLYFKFFQLNLFFYNLSRLSPPPKKKLDDNLCCSRLQTRGLCFSVSSLVWSSHFSYLSGDAAALYFTLLNKVDGFFPRKTLCRLGQLCVQWHRLLLFLAQLYEKVCRSPVFAVGHRFFFFFFPPLCVWNRGWVCSLTES